MSGPVLPGIDLSKSQPSTPTLTGLAYVIVQAGWGSGNGPDPMYATHAANTRAAGKALGAYWYWYDGQDNAVAVRDFLAIARDAAYLALDLEGPNSDTASGHAQAADFISRVHAAGREIGLYTSLSGYPKLGQDWNWVAYYATTAPTIPWLFWQYGPVVIDGRKIDGDRFAGDAAAFAAFIASQGAPAMPVLSASPTPGYVDIPGGETLYDVDGVSILGTTKQQLNTFSPGGPKGSTVLRFYWRSFQDGVWQLVSAAPNGAVRPLPDVNAATTAAFADARDKAAAIAAAATASIRAIT